MERYFNTADKIVFRITLLSFIWIICYKFFWVDMNPLFCNAEKWADITYIVTSSIVASGIFYLFTIFIPKCFEIKKMILHLTNTLDTLDYFVNVSVSYISNSQSNKNYNNEDLISLMQTDLKRVEQDFISYLSQSNSNYYNFQESIKLNISILNIIIDTHSTMIPKEIYSEIIELCKSYNQSIKILDIYKPESKKEYIVTIMENIVKIRNMIKHYYNIK